MLELTITASIVWIKGVSVLPPIHTLINPSHCIFTHFIVYPPIAPYIYPSHRTSTHLPNFRIDTVTYACRHAEGKKTNVVGDLCPGWRSGTFRTSIFATITTKIAWTTPTLPRTSSATLELWTPAFHSFSMTTAPPSLELSLKYVKPH